MRCQVSNFGVRAVLMVGVGVAVLVGFDSQMVTQSAPQTDLRICNDPANINKCQKTCIKVCEDPKFRFKEVNGYFPYRKPCKALMERKVLKEDPSCGKISKKGKENVKIQRTCLDEVEAYKSFEDRIDDQKKEIIEQIKIIEKDDSLPEMVRKKSVFDLQQQLKALDGMLAGVEGWKCRNIQAPQMGGRDRVTIGHPGALSIYYKKCLGGYVKDLQKKASEIRSLYDKMEMRAVCEKLKKNNIKKRVSSDMRKAVVVANTLIYIKQMFNYADECMNSIVQWANDKRKKERRDFICGGRQDCQQAWDEIIRGIESDLDEVKEVRMAVDRDISALNEAVGKIKSITNIGALCK